MKNNVHARYMSLIIPIHNLAKGRHIYEDIELFVPKLFLLSNQLKKQLVQAMYPRKIVYMSALNDGVVIVDDAIIRMNKKSFLE